MAAPCAFPAAGAAPPVAEFVPTEVAGGSCPGRVLVIYDARGIAPGRPARFVRSFATGRASVPAALAEYVAALRGASLPVPGHGI